MTQTAGKTSARDTMSKTTAMSACAFAAASILILRTLSLSLSVLLMLGLVLLCGILIHLVLRSSAPRTEQS